MFLQDEILKYQKNYLKKQQLRLFTDYHFGGYAKINQELVDFVNKFYTEQQIKLDLVYTAKLFYGIFDLIQESYFPKGSKIVLIHSGGLQGNRGMEKRGHFKLFES